jgi:hypothetical protein
MVPVMRNAGLIIIVIAAFGCSDDGMPSDSDAGNDTGAKGDAAPPVKPISMQALVDACARASACGVRTYPILGNCIEAYHTLYLPQGLGPIYDAIYSCINAAKGDCKAIEACYDVRGPCDSSYKDSCDGDVALTCDLIEKRVFAFKCADAKMKCQIKKDGSRESAICTVDTCYSTFGNVCQDDRLLRCVNGLMEVHECSVDGLICSDAQGSAQCIGETSISCKPKTFSPSCQGSKRITCVNRIEHHFDCAKQVNIATKCVGSDCAVAGTECDHDINRCAGEQLEVCLDGRWTKIDCKQLGLGACQQQGSAANCSQ